MNPEDKERPINEETRSRYGVTAYPAVLFVSSDGGLIQKASGFLTPEQFSPIMKDALKKETEFQEKLEKLKAKSDDAKLNAQVALTYLEREQFEKAVLFSEKAFEHDPKNRTKLIPNLHNQLGLAYGALVEGSMLGNSEEAEMYFEKAVSHFKTVIDTYAIKGNFEDAIAVLEKLTHHAKDGNIRQNAEAMLERVKDLASSN